MASINQKIFYRRAIPFGNSSGVLLPKSLLGANIKAVIIKPPINIKKDVTNLLSPILEHILGIYVVVEQEKKTEILAISTNINRHMERGYYSIDIVPLELLKKSLKNNNEIREKIKKAKGIINALLLNQLKKDL